MTAQGPGETARTYAAVREIDNFAQSMAWLAQLFTTHPELRAVSASVVAGKIDIIADAAPGVLRDWIRALDPVVHEESIYQIHSGVAYEDVLKAGRAVVHVRRGGL